MSVGQERFDAERFINYHQDAGLGTPVGEAKEELSIGPWNGWDPGVSIEIYGGQLPSSSSLSETESGHAMPYVPAPTEVY